VLDVDNLVKDYGNFVALDGVTITVESQAITAMFGVNGAGKSSLLRCCAGLSTITSGSVKIGGDHLPGSIEARRLTSFIPDEPVLYDDLSVIEHLEYVARMHDVDDWKPRADELLTRLGINHRRDDLPAQFSRGLRQKTSLCIGLIRPFTLLMVDEPFVGLDASGRQALVGLLCEAADEGAAVLISTHELGFADVASRCIVLGDGSVLADGELDEADISALIG
jgi:ABC-2 type transport system ATP-binding protein